MTLELTLCMLYCEQLGFAVEGSQDSIMYIAWLPGIHHDAVAI